MCNYGEGRTEADGLQHFSPLNYTKLLFWIIANQSAVIAFLYILYTTTILYIIFYAIMWYYGIMLWYTMLICFNAIIWNYTNIQIYYIMRYCRTMILYYYMRYYVMWYWILHLTITWPCDIVLKTTLWGFAYSYPEKVNIIYSQKISKTFFYKRLTNKK